MDEKTMVSDALVGVNGELKMFGDMIPQTEKQRTENSASNRFENQCENVTGKTVSGSTGKKLLRACCKSNPAGS